MSKPEFIDYTVVVEVEVNGVTFCHRMKHRTMRGAGDAADKVAAALGQPLKLRRVEVFGQAPAATWVFEDGKKSRP